jgi:hypothetical protein
MKLHVSKNKKLHTNNKQNTSCQLNSTLQLGKNKIKILKLLIG